MVWVRTLFCVGAVACEQRPFQAHVTRAETSATRQLVEWRSEWRSLFSAHAFQITLQRGHPARAGRRQQSGSWQHSDSEEVQKNPPRPAALQQPGARYRAAKCVYANIASHADAMHLVIYRRVSISVAYANPACA